MVLIPDLQTQAYLMQQIISVVHVKECFIQNEDKWKLQHPPPQKEKHKKDDAICRFLPTDKLNVCNQYFQETDG